MDLTILLAYITLLIPLLAISYRLFEIHDDLEKIIKLIKEETAGRD